MTPTDQPLSVSGLLRRYRLAASLSQEALAERAGLSIEAISSIERGLRQPRRPTLLALGRALNLAPLQMASLEVAQRRSGRPRSVSPPPGLPHTTTPALGREHDVAILTYLLHVAHEHLVTLTGTGGVGKTRLAQQIAIEVAADFPNGVVWVDLAPLRDPALVAPTIARQVGVPDQGALPLHDRLVAALGQMHALLVLDNFEHLIAARDFVATLLAACPGVSILVTSRAALRLVGEQEYVVAPLRLPGSLETTPEEVEQAPAVALFMQRARAVVSTLRLTATTAPVVTQICQRLDGLPLAIELAASLVRVLPPSEMLARLQAAAGLAADAVPVGGTSSLDVLATGAWGLPDRQQTMRTTIAWSHNLLTVAEQALFRSLAVFVGGWSAEAAAAIVSPGDTLDAAALLDGLVRQNLVRRDTGDNRGTEGRYGMLETIHAFAAERLDSSTELAATRARHAAHYLALAEQADMELYGPEQRQWFARMAREHDNLRAAVQWALEQGKVEVGLRIVGALWKYWEVRGHLREALSWLENLLPRAAEEAISAAVRAKALLTGGILAYRLDEYARVAPWLEQSLALYRDLGDLGGVGHVLNNLGNVALATGDAVRAAAYFDEAAALQRTLGDRRRLASALNNLAEARYQQGRMTEAAALYTESLALYQEVEDTWSIASVLNNLGSVALDQQDYAQATALYERSLALRRELGNQPGIALVLSNLAQVALGQGDAQRATALYGQSLDIHRQMDSRVGMAQCFEGLAEATITLGLDERGAAFLGIAMVLREDVGAPLTLAEETVRDRALATLRHRLGDDAIAQALARGRTWLLTQAVHEATTPPTSA